MRETWIQSLGWDDSLEGRHGNPLQYSCLENPHGQRIRGATVHGVPGVRHDWATKHSTAQPPHQPVISLKKENTTSYLEFHFSWVADTPHRVSPQWLEFLCSRVQSSWDAIIWLTQLVYGTELSQRVWMLLGTSLLSLRGRGKGR